MQVNRHRFVPPMSESSSQTQLQWHKKMEKHLSQPLSLRSWVNNRSKSIGRLVESNAPSVLSIPAFICRLICRILLPGDVLINRFASWSEPTWATQWVRKLHTATIGSVTAKLTRKKWFNPGYLILRDNQTLTRQRSQQQQAGCRGEVIGVSNF